MLEYVQAHPGQSCQEAEIRRETGVAKNRVRNLVRGLPGIDPVKLDSGVVCWSPHLMKVLLARIGFMKFYKGPKPGDEKPIGGGKYNTEGIGHEAYNFLNISGSLYGYFQPHMKSPYEINLGRIEQGYGDDKIDNVLVIWFATNPIGRGQVVEHSSGGQGFQSDVEIRLLIESHAMAIKERQWRCFYH